MFAQRPKLICTGCDKVPVQIAEYVEAAADNYPMTPDDYVWKEEGTLNKENGHFLCTTCYLRAGAPTSPKGWKAP